MTPEEEFDSAAQAAEATLNQYPVESIELPGAFKAFLEDLNSMVPWASNAGVNPAVMAANIAASMRALLATRGLTTTDQEKQQFAAALLVLQAEYMDARNKAMQGTASRYVITESLRAQKAALTNAYNKIKHDAAVMAQIADAANGLSALIKAIV